MDSYSIEFLGACCRFRGDITLPNCGLQFIYSLLHILPLEFLTFRIVLFKALNLFYLYVKRHHACLLTLQQTCNASVCVCVCVPSKDSMLSNTFLRHLITWILSSNSKSLLNLSLSQKKILVPADIGRIHLPLITNQHYFYWHKPFFTTIKRLLLNWWCIAQSLTFKNLKNTTNEI